MKKGKGQWVNNLPLHDFDALGKGSVKMLLELFIPDKMLFYYLSAKRTPNFGPKSEFR